MHIEMCFTSYQSMAETGPQHIQAPLAASISPLAISPDPRMKEVMPDYNTRTPCPTLHATSVWVLLRPTFLWTLKGCEMGPMVYCPHPRRLQSLTICRCDHKGSTFSSVTVFEDPECWSGWNFWFRDLKHERPMLNQVISQSVGSFLGCEMFQAVQPSAGLWFRCSLESFGYISPSLSLYVPGLLIHHWHCCGFHSPNTFYLNFKVFVHVTTVDSFSVTFTEVFLSIRMDMSMGKQLFFFLVFDDNVWSVGFYLTICLIWACPIELLYDFPLTLFAARVRTIFLLC